MPEIPTKKISLLYVGNNPEILHELDRHADTLDVTHEDNGLKAVDYLRRYDKIDAILADAIMPGIKGDEFATHIKERLGMWKIPVIIISLEKDVALKARFFQKKSVVDDLYFCPIDFEQILSRIQFLIYYHNELKESKKSKVSKKNKYRIPLIKRLFDIISSSVALLLLSPLFIILAIAIRIESKGPVIYKSKRVGTGYRIFDFLKFRSMYTGADKELKDLGHLNLYNNGQNRKEQATFKECPRCAKLPKGEFCSHPLYVDGKMICEYWYHEISKSQKTSTFIKIENDPRITKVGKFIRNTSMDELPQLINVLKGDMSIVGNRPLPLYEAELLTSDDWSARFIAPAGITGLWQVELRGKGGDMSEEERKALDNQYAQTFSVWGDIKLIFRTIPALFQKGSV